METGWLKTYLDFKKKALNGARTRHTNPENRTGHTYNDLSFNERWQ